MQVSFLCGEMFRRIQLSSISLKVETYSKCHSIAGSSVVFIPSIFKDMIADSELLNKQMNTYMNIKFFAEPLYLTFF